MTGFGRARVGDVNVEVRAVNHRHLDLKVRPALPAELEREIAAAVRAVVERGALQIAIDVVAESSAPASGPRAVDAAAAARAHAELSELAHTLRLPAPGLADVLAVPGVVVGAGGRRGEPEPLRPAADQVLAALTEALAALVQMRAREGDALARDLASRLGTLRTHHAAMRQLAGDVPARLRDALVERVQRAGGPAIEPTRLAQEAALLADRADVTEELVRLDVHLSELAALLAASGAIGRRLDFLIQEVARELGTIGAKAPSAEIVTHVVAAKAELEKAREQAQNVE